MYAAAEYYLTICLDAREKFTILSFNFYFVASRRAIDHQPRESTNSVCRVAGRLARSGPRDVEQEKFWWESEYQCYDQPQDDQTFYRDGHDEGDGVVTFLPARPQPLRVVFLNHVGGGVLITVR